MRTGRFFAVVVIGWVILSSISFGYSGWIAGKTGNALGFDGVNDYVEVTGYQGIVGTQSRTCSAWIKTTGTQQGYILSWGADQAGQKWMLRVESNGALSAVVWGGYVYTTATVNDGQWHHVAAVLNDDGSPSVNEILVYIDGFLQSTTATSTQSIETVASNDMIIGAFNNAGVISSYFNGLLDEVCIYGRALEPNEIDPEAQIPTDGLVAYWAMDETEGEIAYETVSSYDGVLRNIYAQVHHVSTLGNDTNDGFSWATAKKTITAAINACGPSDSIWVAQGTYNEQVRIHLGFDIALYGGFSGTETDLSERNWMLHKTVLTAGSMDVCVVCSSGSPRIDGFVITNSSRGIYCSYSSPTIINNVITDNHYQNTGGGIKCSYSSARIINNIIAGNAVTASAEGFGGGGIYCESSSPILIHNTIVKNIATYGGGVCFRDSSPTLINNIIAFNSSGIYRGGSPGLPVFRNNCTYGNVTYDFNGLADPAGTDGNISTDPNFVSADKGDFHLQPGSACIDAGCNDDVQSELDIDGQQRILPEGGVVDIGADECDGISRTYTPDVIIRVSPEGIYTNDGSSWSATRPLMSAIRDMNGRNGEIWVKQGTYRMNYPQNELKSFVHIYGGFNGTETSRESRNPESYPTILDGQSYGTALCIDGRACCTIDGFTITNGNRYGGISCEFSMPTVSNNTIKGNAGNGITCESSCATITHNTIKENSASRGGGIYCSSSPCFISDNVITANKGDWGGGIFCQGYRSIISNNIISNNTVFTTGKSWDGYDFRGGGIYSISNSIIKNNTIVNNFTVKGGGIYCAGSPIISNNIIAANIAYHSGIYLGTGGGIYCESSSSLVLVNNTIIANKAQDGGGGVYSYSSSATLANNIVADNQSGLCLMGVSSVRNNCVYGNIDYNYSGITDPTGNDGNISIDPNFACIEYYNLHLQPGSPCIDAGSNSDVVGDTDIDGQSRVQPINGTVDIGAHEWDGTTWPFAPNVIIRVSSEGSDTNDGLSWATSKRTIQAGIDTAFVKGGEVWVKAGLYQERIKLFPFVYLYGGFVGTEENREKRNFIANKSILDGLHAGKVVEAINCQLGAIDGFTITNGYTGNMEGGGIYCGSYSCPTISNNIIMNNHSVSGGGIGCYSYSSPKILNNIIRCNSAINSSGGGINCLYYSSPMISGNLILANSAYSGGGISWSNYSSPVLLNNTIIANTATSEGDGVYGYYNAGLIVANNIIAFSARGIKMNGTPVDFEFRNNCVYGNTEYDYSGISNQTGIGGNISSDPEFMRNPWPGSDGTWGNSDDDYGDLRLTAGSHCIDMGDNASIPADILTDLGGEYRVVNGDGYAEPIVDIGAYEYYLSGDLNEGGGVNMDDFSLFTTQWLQIDCTRPDNCSQADLDRDGAVETEDLILLAEHWLEGI